MPCNTQLGAVCSLLCGPSLSEAYIEKDQRKAAPKYCPTIYSDDLNYDLSVYRLTPLFTLHFILYCFTRTDRHGDPKTILWVAPG